MEYFNYLLKTLPIWPFIVLSALFTGLIVLHVNKKNAFRKYAMEFRNAFNQELTILESKGIEDINVRELLLEAFDKHSEAVTEFREHISILKKRGFNKAWRQYYYGQPFDPDAWGFKGKDSVLLQYLPINDKETGFTKNLAIKNIRRLLKYAKENWVYAEACG